MTAGRSLILSPDPSALRSRPKKRGLSSRKQRQPRCRFRSLDQPLPRMRARLHLLLRPPGPCLYGPVARPRFRKQAVLQAWRRQAAGAGTQQAANYNPATVHIGGNTDPYQPQERTLRVTREIIEVMARFRHPMSVITKSALITRDIDLFGADGRGGVRAGGRVDHHAGSRSRPGDGTPRGDAGAASGRGAPAYRRGRAGHA